MKEIDLSNTPRPHYLKSGTVTTEDKNGFFSFRGEVLFPLSDTTIKDRGHVNVAHQMFAVWNLAHFAAREGFLYPHIRILSLSGSYFAETPVDIMLGLSAEVEILRKNNVDMKGCATAVLRNCGERISTIHVVFLATK